MPLSAQRERNATYPIWRVPGDARHFVCNDSRFGTSCNSIREELPRFLKNACNFAPGSAEGRNCHVVGRFFQRRRREKNEMDRLSIRFLRLSPKRGERGAGVHKWQRREDERVRTPFWTFVRRLSFWQTPTSDDDRQGGVTGTLFGVSVDKYNRQTDWG